MSSIAIFVYIMCGQVMDLPGLRTYAQMGVGEVGDKSMCTLHKSTTFPIQNACKYGCGVVTVCARGGGGVITIFGVRTKRVTPWVP